MQSLSLHDVSERPWQKVAMDIFTVKTRNYLVTVDYYSQLFGRTYEIRECDPQAES